MQTIPQADVLTSWQPIAEGAGREGLAVICNGSVPVVTMVQPTGTMLSWLPSFLSFLALFL